MYPIPFNVIGLAMALSAPPSRLLLPVAAAAAALLLALTVQTKLKLKTAESGRRADAAAEQQDVEGMFPHSPPSTPKQK